MVRRNGPIGGIEERTAAEYGPPLTTEEAEIRTNQDLVGPSRRESRHYGVVAHSETEPTRKLAGLLTVEGSTLGLYEWADRYLELWVAAGKDEAKDAGSFRQFVKKWSELSPLHG